METNVSKLLDKVSEHVESLASTETILGDEFTLGAYACRPVIKVGTGFGSAAADSADPKGKGKGNGEGAAAGIGVTPLGFLATKGEEISFIPASKIGALSDILEKIPDLVEKISEMKNKEDKKESKTEKKDSK